MITNHMGAVISALEKETERKYYDTFRRCLDRERASLVEYDDHARTFMSAQGETAGQNTSAQFALLRLSSRANTATPQKHTLHQFILGKKATLEKIPTTIDNFCFGTDKDTLLNPFDVVVVEHLHGSKTYSVVEEISNITDSDSFLANFKVKEIMTI